MGRKKVYKVYNVRARKTLITSVVVFVLCCLIVAVLVIVFALGNKGDNVVSSNIVSYESTIISSSFTAIETSSITEKEENSSDITSSEIETSSNAETSSQKSSTSSKKSSTSSKNKTSSGASVATGNKDNYGLPFDVYKEAEEWTYVIDKSKPVPLQPAVKDDFFSDAMFVGDSITTGIDLYNIVKGAPVVAYTGINSNTILTRQVFRSGSSKITFLQQMKKYNPKHIYIMLGINGIAFQSKEKFISGYSDFVDAVKKQHPNANIYLQSILPVTANKQKSDSRFANSKINSYNKAILKLAEEKGVYYLNVAESFKNSSGNMPGAASADGIHFGTAYYRRWIEYLRRHVVRRATPPTETVSKTISSQS